MTLLMIGCGVIYLCSWQYPYLGPGGRVCTGRLTCHDVMSATDDTPTPVKRPATRWKSVFVRIMTNHPELVCISIAIVFSICSKLCQRSVSIFFFLQMTILPKRLFIRFSVWLHMLRHSLSLKCMLSECLRLNYVIAKMCVMWCVQYMLITILMPQAME